MYSKLNAARVYTYAVARAIDNGELENVRKECAAALLMTAESCTWSCLEAIQILGGNGKNVWVRARVSARVYDLARVGVFFGI